MSHNIFAYTPPGSDYPPFISVNQVDTERVEVIVRSSKKPDGTCGDCAQIVLGREELKRLYTALLQALIGTGRA